MRAVLVVVGLVALMVVASTFPLALYATSISIFGLAHVAYEMRYVDGRFGLRVDRVTLVVLLALCAVLMIGRVLFMTGALPNTHQPAIELAILAMLALAVVFRAKDTAVVIPAVVVGAVTMSCALNAPLAAVSAFALLHNATPLGFLVEAAPDGKRARTALSWAALFLVPPILVGSGAVEGALAALGVHASATSGPLPGDIGGLAAHVNAFAPKGLELDPWARRIFAAGACGQILHYVATIGIFPRTARANGDREHLVPWPSPALFLAGVVVATAVLIAGFLASFKDARAIYSVPAAFHAFIEIPVLLIGLGALVRRRAVARSS